MITTDIYWELPMRQAATQAWYACFVHSSPCLLCWSWLVPVIVKYPGFFWASVKPFISENWPWWEYLHQRNGQMLQIRVISVYLCIEPVYQELFIFHFYTWETDPERLYEDNNNPVMSNIWHELLLLPLLLLHLLFTYYFPPELVH